MAEVRDDVLLDGEVPLVHLARKGERIEVLNRGAVLGVAHLAVLHEADAVDLFPGFPLAQLRGGVVELAAADDVDRAVGETQALLGEYAHVRAGEHGHRLGALRLDLARRFHVDGEGRGGGVHHHHVEILGDFQAGVEIKPLHRCVNDARPRDHTRGVG